MNAGELIEELKKHPEEMRVCVFDGMDPSDPTEASEVRVQDDNRALDIYEPYLFISP